MKEQKSHFFKNALEILVYFVFRTTERWVLLWNNLWKHLTKMTYRATGHLLAWGTPSLAVKVHEQSKWTKFLYFTLIIRMDTQTLNTPNPPHILMISTLNTATKSYCYLPSAAAGPSLPSTGGGSSFCLLSVLDRSGWTSFCSSFLSFFPASHDSNLFIL